MPPLALSRLVLTRFRSWPVLDWRPSARLVVIAGENGAGKTNLLEAISLLGPGRGLRGARPAEFGTREAEGPVAWAVAARLDGPGGGVEIGTGTAPGAPGGRRVLRLDGEPASQASLARHAAALWITPQMQRLFQDGASDRRRFLDRLAWSLEPEHARSVAAHDQAMAGRNRLLGEGRAEAAWLAALEDQMARHAVAATAARRALVLRLNALLAGGVAGAFPAARLSLRCPIAEALEAAPALAVEDGLRERLATERARDAAAGGAASGAHRADLAFTHLPKELPAELCSTGEQKALLVSVTLAQAALVAEQRGFAPLLLLDEVAAHLDAERRAALFAALRALPAQAFLTGTEASVFAPLADIAEGFRALPGRLSAEPGFRAVAAA
jgi:DNA replication and repair protein RecF